MSSSSPPHPQNMLEKPLTYRIKRKYLLWGPNLFELFGCHCCNASKIVGIGQLPSPLVHPRGHQKWMLDIYKEGGNLTRSLQLVSTQFIRNGNCSVHNVTFEQRYVFVSFCGSRSTSWNMRQAQGKSISASLKQIIRWCGSCSETYQHFQIYGVLELLIRTLKIV